MRLLHHLRYLRIRANFRLWRENLTVFAAIGVATGAVLLLFFYIFSDFFDKKVAALRPEWFETLSRLGIYGGGALLGYQLGRIWLNEERAAFSFYAWLGRVGTGTSLRRLDLGLSFLGSSLLYSVLYLGGVWYFFKYEENLLFILLWILTVNTLSYLGGQIFTRGESRERPSYYLRFFRVFTFCKAPLRWHAFSFIGLFGRSSWFCFGIGGIFFLLAIFAREELALSFFFPLVAYISGLLGAAFLASYASLAAKTSAVEIRAGLDHDGWMQSIEAIAILFGLILGLFYFAIGAGLFGLGCLPLSSAFDAAWLALVAPALVPAFVFQISAAHAFIIWLCVFLASLFLGFSILVSPLFVVGLPLALYYGRKSQRGRIYL